VGAAIGEVLGLAAGVAVSPLPIVAMILLLAVRQWRGRPAPEAAPEMPKWMAGLDQLKPGGALGLGALLSGVNPKNAALTIAAAATIAGAGLPGGSRRSPWPCLS
jgi:Sap, sulfolipid-1-addressing protein